MTNPIREAMTRLEGHWAHRLGQDEDGNKCGMIWLTDVLAETDEWKETGAKGIQHPATHLLNRVAAEQYPDRSEGRYFYLFNDHEDTTEAEVLEVMDKAAVRYDEYESH